MKGTKFTTPKPPSLLVTLQMQVFFNKTGPSFHYVTEHLPLGVSFNMALMGGRNDVPLFINLSGNYQVYNQNRLDN